MSLREQDRLATSILGKSSLVTDCSSSSLARKVIALVINGSISRVMSLFLLTMLSATPRQMERHLPISERERTKKKKRKKTFLLLSGSRLSARESSFSSSLPLLKGEEVDLCVCIFETDSSLVEQCRFCTWPSSVSLPVSQFLLVSFSTFAID